MAIDGKSNLTGTSTGNYTGLFSFDDIPVAGSPEAKAQKVTITDNVLTSPPIDNGLTFDNFLDKLGKLAGSISYEKTPDGTTYKVGGFTYVKKGGKVYFQNDLNPTVPYNQTQILTWLVIGIVIYIVLKKVA